MNTAKNKIATKQLSVRFDEDIYFTLMNLSKHQNKSFAKLINEFVRKGMVADNNNTLLIEFLETIISVNICVCNFK